MTTRGRPWSVEDLRSIYSPHCQARLPDGRWVMAVSEPYAPDIIERLRAAWWVLTGRATAFLRPKAGDLEAAVQVIACDIEEAH